MEYSPKVKLALVNQFYGNIPAAVATNVVNAIIMVAVLYEDIPFQLLFTWLIALLLTLLFRLALNRRFQTSEDKNNNH